MKHHTICEGINREREAGDWNGILKFEFRSHKSYRTVNGSDMGQVSERLTAAS